MDEKIDIQHQTNHPIPVSDETLSAWIQLALAPDHQDYDVTLRLVDAAEIQDLNRTYRQQDKPTNVLAFPTDLPPEILQFHPFLGDIIICPEVLEKESLTQNTPLNAHWAHIVIHGILHLLGYDHIQEQDTIIMQTREIQLLEKLGFNNPYINEDNDLE